MEYSFSSTDASPHTNTTPHHTPSVLLHHVVMDPLGKPFFVVLCALHDLIDPVDAVVFVVVVSSALRSRWMWICRHGGGNPIYGRWLSQKLGLPIPYPSEELFERW